MMKLRLACDVFREWMRKGACQREGEMIETPSEIPNDIADDERERVTRKLVGTRLYEDPIGNIRIVFGPHGMMTSLKPLPDVTMELVQVTDRSCELERITG